MAWASSWHSSAESSPGSCPQSSARFWLDIGSLTGLSAAPSPEWWEIFDSRSSSVSLFWPVSRSFDAADSCCQTWPAPCGGPRWWTTATSASKSLWAYWLARWWSTAFDSCWPPASVLAHIGTLALEVERTTFNSDCSMYCSAVHHHWSNLVRLPSYEHSNSTQRHWSDSSALGPPTGKWAVDLHTDCAPAGLSTAAIISDW